MRKNLKTANLFAFSLLMVSGLISISFNNNLNLKENNSKTVQSHGVIIDFEGGYGTFGATVDTDLDGYADTLYMWGQNNIGQVGNGTSGNGEFENNVLIPTIIEPDGGWNGNLIDLSLGYDASAVTVDTDLDGYADTLYVWGNQWKGSLSKPTMVEDQDFWNGNLLNLSSGFINTGVTVDTDGDGFGNDLYMWGDNYYGQLGLDETIKGEQDPVLIGSADKITDFDLGYYGSGAIINDSTLYTWGTTIIDDTVFEPTITTPKDSDWQNNDLLSLDFTYYSYSLLSDSNSDGIADSMWVWGDNRGNKLDSNISEESILNPTLSSDFNGDDGNIINASLGVFNTGVLIDSDSDGKGDKVLTRGDNNFGQIGNNTTINPNEYVEIYFKDSEGQEINGDFSKLVISDFSSGLLADLNKDGYNDTIYLWGDNTYGQLGNGTTESNSLIPYLAFSLIELNIDSVNIYSKDNQTISIDIVLKDLSDFYNEENIPTIKIKDTDGNELTPIIDEANSDFSSDSYIYTLSGLDIGTEYNFDSIIIDDIYQFKIDNSVITDYLISGVSLNNVSANTATLDLNLSLNNDFNYSNFDESQRQVKINFDDQTSIESVINANDQIIIDGLNSSTSYNIASIDYNFDKDTSSYKYNILTPNLSFVTADFDLILEANSFSINGSSITASSFTYSIDINNLDKDETNDGFKNFDPNNGLYLIDDDYNSYQTTYIEDSEKEIGIGQEQNTFEYQFTFKISNLNSDKTYDFIGISFTNPLSQDDPAIVAFDNNVLIKTEKDKNNLVYLWVFIAIILILLIVILLATSFNLVLKKRNIKMIETLNTVTSKS